MKRVQTPLDWTDQEVKEFLEKTVEFACQVHGVYRIRLNDIWRTTMRCKLCDRVLNQVNDGTIAVWDHKDEE